MHETIMFDLVTQRMAERRAEAAEYRLHRSLRRPRTRIFRNQRNRT
jgi:hypothetical protein